MLLLQAPYNRKMPSSPALARHRLARWSNFPLLRLAQLGLGNKDAEPHAFGSVLVSTANDSRAACTASLYRNGVSMSDEEAKWKSRRWWSRNHMLRFLPAPVHGVPKCSLRTPWTPLAKTLESPSVCCTRAGGESQNITRLPEPVRLK